MAQPDQDPSPNVWQAKDSDVQATINRWGNRLANLPKQGSELPIDRQTRLLAWTVFLLFFLMLCTEALVLLLSYPTPQQKLLYAIIPLAYALILIVSFLLNRIRLNRLAALITVLGSIAAVWSAILLDPGIETGHDLIPICYISITLLLSAFLLNRIATLLISLIQNVALFAWMYGNPDLRTTNWVSLLTFLVFITFISLAISHIMHTDLMQIGKQAQSLLAQEASLKDLAIRDSLTGLYNRLYLDETLKREISRVTRRSSTLGVIMIDIDFFKTINDTYGHAVGDEFLQQVGRILAGRIRDSDIACRYGGDEFTLIMPDASLSATYQRAESIRQQAESWAFTIDHAHIQAPSLSCGVALFPDHGQNGQTLLAAADDALLRAKQGGRNRTEVADTHTDS